MSFVAFRGFVALLFLDSDDFNMEAAGAIASRVSGHGEKIRSPGEV